MKNKQVYRGASHPKREKGRKYEEKKRDGNIKTTTKEWKEGKERERERMKE